MKCPVCKTECLEKTICPECGFSEVGKEFINQDDAIQWFESVVTPLRQKYEKGNVLPALDWISIFRKDPQAKVLFDVTIPVSLRKQLAIEYLSPGDEGYTYEVVEQQQKATIEAALGHIFMKSISEPVDGHFIEEVRKAVGQVDDIKAVTLNGNLKPGDLFSILTTLKNNELIVLNVSGKIREEVRKALAQALSEFKVELTIGKGAGARNILLDLPIFTVIFVAKKSNDLPSDFLSSISTFVDLNLPKEELLSYQISELAEKHNVLLTKATLDLLTEQLKPINANATLKFISDYLFLHPEIKQPVGSNELRQIISNIINVE